VVIERGRQFWNGDSGWRPGEPEKGGPVYLNEWKASLGGSVKRIREVSHWTAAQHRAAWKSFGHDMASGMKDEP